MAWVYFTKDEMSCECGCGQAPMDSHFMDLLDSLRRAVGEPITVNSGYRCPTCDTEIGGGGNHTQGKAVDLKCIDGTLRFKIVSCALQLGFKRIGIAKTFIHLDMCEDSGRPQQVIWLY